MLKDTQYVLVNLANRVIQLEVRERALLKILAEQGNINLEELQVEINQRFDAVKKEAMMDLLEMTEEEYALLEGRKND